MRLLLSGPQHGWFRPLLFGATILALAWALTRENSAEQTDLSPTSTVAARPVPDQDDRPDGEIAKAESLSRMFRRAANKVLPAVVVIKAGSSPACPHCGRHHGHNSGHEFGPEWPFAPMAAEPSLDLLGSGFVVDPSGIVLTNKHVVAGGHRLVVQTADGEQFSVEDVKMDREHDLAILRIESEKPLAFVRLGDSTAAEIGDWVLTIGCPLELEQTVSAGIVSAKNRSLCSTHPAKFIQTDAVINPGSSGGPLVNLHGEVIGITTAIASEDGGFQGIGFAIPANHASRLLAQSAE